MTSQAPIDLRSDTVTRPDAVMRAAMAAAEVADDVLEHDPTMRAVEERAAELLGMPAALWVPTGSMGNNIALCAHLGRGDRFLVSRAGHILGNELGAVAWLAGGMPEVLEWGPGPGRPSPEAVRAAPVDGPYHQLRTTLLCLENTHNAAGGTVTPPDEHRRLVSAAKDRDLRVHLDGARIWNASVALGVPPSDLTAGVDTVLACFSKGLGAPVGSVIAGSESFVAEARRLRKMFGGGVRQGGVLAAAGLIGLDRIGDLAVDHENAATLATGLAELGWQVSKPETNIVLATVADLADTLRRLTEIGVLATSTVGQVRLVTHRDVSSADITEALYRIKTSV